MENQNSVFNIETTESFLRKSSVLPSLQHFNSTEDKKQNKAANNYDLHNKMAEMILFEAIKILKAQDEDMEIDPIKVDVIVKATKKMAFFENINKNLLNVQLNLHQRFCKVLKFKSYPKGSVIFQQDGVSDALYIVLTGSVNIFQCKTPNELAKEKEWMNKHCEITEIDIDPMTGKATKQDSVSDSNLKKAKKVDKDAKNKRKSVLYRIGNLVFNSIQKNFLEDLTQRDSYQIKEELETSESESESLNGENTLGENKDYRKIQLLEGLKGEGSLNNVSSYDDDDFAYEESVKETQEETELGKAKKLLYKWFGEIDPDCIEGKENYFTNGIKNIAFDVCLDSGYAFGDLGFRKKQRKSKVVICKEDTEFGVIGYEDYKNLVKLVQERKHRERINFVELSMFSEASRNAATCVVNSMKKERFTKNQRFYTERERPEKLYLIKEGEIELTAIKEDQSFKKPKGVINFETIIDDSPFLKKVGSPGRRIAPIAYLARGQYFGDEDLLEHRPRTITARCYSQKATAYSITRNELLKVFLDYPQLKEILQNKFRVKNFRRENQETVFSEFLNRESNKRGPHSLDRKPIRADLDEIFNDSNKQAIHQNILKYHAKKELSPIPQHLLNNMNEKSPEKTSDYKNRISEPNPRRILFRGVLPAISKEKPASKTANTSKIMSMVNTNLLILQELTKNSSQETEIFVNTNPKAQDQLKKQKRRFEIQREKELKRDLKLVLPTRENEVFTINVQSKLLRRLNYSPRRNRNFSVEETPMSVRGYLEDNTSIVSHRKLGNGSSRLNVSFV